MNYFYDNQFRRYLLQFMRIFGDIKTQVSPGVLRRVPIKYGDMSRMVAMILRDNSQNTIMQAPQMSAHIASIEMAPERRRDPAFVRNVRAVERNYDPNEDSYTTEPGNRYTVESFMPVPYTLNMNLDIWTMNSTDKFQIIEQIITVFNPGVQLQQNSNALDWTSIFEVELTNINWSSRGVPAGVDSANDFATLQFRLPIWITPPSRVTRQRVIETIVTNVFAESVTPEDLDSGLDVLNSCFDAVKQFVVTPGNLSISVMPQTESLSVVSLQDSAQWSELFPLSGNVDLNGGLLTLKTQDDLDSTSGDITGTVTVQGNDLLFAVDSDSLPEPDTVITAVVDPTVTWPGNGLPAAQAGQRYLFVDQQQIAGGGNLVPEQPDGPWGSLVAAENDIVEYDGTQWLVVFDHSTGTHGQSLKNLSDGQHYTFRNGQWGFTYIGEYTPGYWRLEV